MIDFSEYVIDGTLRLRYAWRFRAEIDFLPYFNYRRVPVQPVRLTLQSAQHNRLGDVSMALGRSSDLPVRLRPGDSLKLAYTLPSRAERSKRILYALFKGRYRRLDLAKPNDFSETLPTSIVFGNPYPNPANPGTIFQFALPAAMPVKLELFNILGQRVVTVVDGMKEAGAHSIDWAGQNQRGEGVATGIYLARLTAGAFAQTKKVMVVK